VVGSWSFCFPIWENNGKCDRRRAGTPKKQRKKVFEKEVIMGCEMVLDISATHSRIFYTFAP
jgi:hypothetical protein